MAIKLFITDLDKTLLRSDGSISQENIAAFGRLKQAGILPVIASGRSEYESIDAARAIGATQYLISLTGCRVYDYPRNHMVYHQAIPRECVLQSLEILEAQEGLFYQMYAGNTSYTSHKSYAHMKSCGLPHSYVAVTREAMEVHANPVLVAQTQDVEKFFMSAQDPAVLENIARQTTRIQGLDTLASLTTAIELIPAHADKGVAIKKLCEYLDIRQDEVMAVGDSENDLAMFDAAGVCVAVENAFDCLKQRAHHIVPANDANGVAHAIQHLLGV